MEENLRRFEGLKETTMNGALSVKAMEVLSFEYGSNKRRKVCSQLGDGEVKFSSENSVSATLESSSSDSSGAVKNASDLKGEDFEIDDDNPEKRDCRFSRETTPTTELQQNSSVTKMESKSSSSSSSKPKKISTAVISRHQKPETPSAAEIEEFFSAAEKFQQQAFKEKYNYDVVKDMPLEGRYKWVQLKPCSLITTKACKEEQEKKINQCS